MVFILALKIFDLFMEEKYYLFQRLYFMPIIYRELLIVGVFLDFS